MDGARLFAPLPLSAPFLVASFRPLSINLFFAPIIFAGQNTPKTFSVEKFFGKPLKGAEGFVTHHKLAPGAELTAQRVDR